MFVFEKWNSKQYINGHLINWYTDEEMRNFYYWNQNKKFPEIKFKNGIP